MAKQKKLVWLGKGILTRGGKVYKNGDIIPDGIDSKEIESLIAKNKVGNPVKAVDISESTALIEAQKNVIKDLQAEIAEYGEIISGMRDRLSEDEETIYNLKKTSQDKEKKPNDSKKG